MNRLVFVLLLLFSPVLFGCGGSIGEKMLASAADSNAKRLGMLYSQFQLQNTKKRWVGPTNQQEFEEFIKRQNPEHLAGIGIDVTDLEILFVSNRDNLPFKIRWEVQGVSRGPPQPVVFEQQGINDKFVVGFTGFMEQEVDKAEYDRLWSGAADADQGS